MGMKAEVFETDLAKLEKMKKVIESMIKQDNNEKDRGYHKLQLVEIEKQIERIESEKPFENINNFGFERGEREKG